jgi:hypothetical protein
MTRDQVTELLQKLQRLAERAGTPAEAANAADRMAELMERYRISHLELEAAGEAEADPIVEGQDILGCKGKVPEWRAQLIWGLAAANNAQAVSWPGEGRMHVYGRRSDVEAVGYMYAAIAREIDRLAGEAWSVVRRVLWASARTWKNSFRLGAVHEIHRRLQDGKAVREASRSQRGTALCRRLDAEVQRFMDARVGETTPHPISAATISATAYQVGAAAGQAVNLGGGRGLRPPARQLGAAPASGSTEDRGPVP